MKSFVTGDGCEIHYEVQGAGRPLLLIHGWTLDHRMWDRIVPLLIQHFQVIRYDRRGFGESTSHPELKKELSDIDELLTHLNVEKINLVAFSQGGRIALRYCLTRAAKVESLILQGAPLDGYSPEPREQERAPLGSYAQLIANGELEKFRRLWQAHPMMRIPPEDAALARQLQNMLNDYRGQDLVDDVEKAMAFPVVVAERLREITCPVLILDGETEVAHLKQVADKLATDIPNARKIELAGGGHLVCMIDPAAFCGEVIKFLQSLNQSSADKKQNSG